jgi:hypothetical protein
MEANRSPARWMALVPLAIVVIALVPRVAGLDDAVTIDEPLWLNRSDAFYHGIASGHLSQTYQSAHPGVTTMWLAGAGRRLVPKTASPVDDYRRARLPFAVVTALAIGVVWILTRRLFGPLAATIAGLLLALDPFLLAHSRVVHTDALVSLAMLISLLAFLGALRTGHGFAAAGIAAGLAVLTKGTSLVLPPFLLATLAVREAGSVRSALSRQRVRELVRDRRLHVFVLALLGTFVVAWPAVWVRPWDAFAAPFLGAGRGTVLAQEGNFFLGRAVHDPGPLFYPVAAAFRMTPVTLFGAFAAVVWAFRSKGPATRDRRTLVWFALAFLVLITVGAKKLDRFALPALLALVLLAGAAIAELLGRVARRGRSALAGVAAAAIVAAHGVPALMLAPNYLGYFNGMLGGPPVARHAILAGGGEGLDDVAAALNRLGGARLTVATTRNVGIREIFRGRLIPIREGPADYVVFYVSSLQANVAPEIWERYRTRAPVARIRIGGITKAWIWRWTPA